VASKPAETGPETDGSFPEISPALAQVITQGSERGHSEKPSKICIGSGDDNRIAG